jgi:hypothetical protein
MEIYRICTINTSTAVPVWIRTDYDPILSKYVVKNMNLLSFCIYKKVFKHEIYRHYTVLSNYCNKLSSVNLFNECKLCGRSQTSVHSFVLVCLVYSVSIDNMLMWIYEPGNPRKKESCLTSWLTFQP